MSLKQNGSLSYLDVGALMATRLLLRIPFCAELVAHHYKLRLCRVQQNLIYPNKDKNEFKTYKDKVLHILNQIRQQFGRIIYMSHPNNDLAWCSFVIENDYLQISNSISGGESTKNAVKITKKPSGDLRRFSKTISVNFGQRNRSAVDTLKLKTIQKMSFDCANGDFSGLVKECAELSVVQPFAQYFLSNDYNCALVEKATKGNSLFFTLMYLTYRDDWRNLIPKFSDQQFRNLAYSLQQSYRKNFYHNSCHAADVTQNLYYLINRQEVRELCSMTDLQVFCTLISGAAHDMDHPGTNNVFEIKTRSKLALLYNDLSVLENHHAASFFFLVDNEKHDCNIFRHMKLDDRNKCRKQILESILCTDMSKHGQIQEEIKKIGELEPENRKMDSDNKLVIVRALVHAADICNSSRPFPIAKLWAESLFCEFFAQGDKEKELNLEVTYLCDRTKFNFAQSQIGFLQFVTLPYFKAISTVLPKVKDQVEQQIKNVEQYKELVDEYEVYLKQGNKRF
jgi:hypothetical protein